MRRRGLEYHSLRHGTTTKLYQANVSEAWVDLLTGHSDEGGESRKRYLKGVPLPQPRTAIERVTRPELDLSPLYRRDAGDERWSGNEAPFEPLRCLGWVAGGHSYPSSGVSRFG